MRIAIVGAGASGCFCAIEIGRLNPEAEITVFEAGERPLAKVALTGGGRCNFTNSFRNVRELKEVYPRGERLMRRALSVFSQNDCREWFRKEGVPSVVQQEDQCVFPASQDAMQIVRTLKGLMSRCGVRLVCGHPVRSIVPEGGQWKVDGESFDRVVVSSGGGRTAFLGALEIKSEPIVPSLFTLKIPCPELNSLMGICVPDARLCIPGTKFRSGGILLLTDWGISGPATLKLSSYAARHLAECSCRSNVCINWTGRSEEQTTSFCSSNAKEFPLRQLSSVRPEGIPDRLWKHLLNRAGLREDLRWGELGTKGRSRLVSTLTGDVYPVEGRARFKEEFVSCGGISLEAVDISTLEAKNFPGLYFTGEVLDIDAVTGGFNLQAAWSTAIVAARSICNR